MGLCATTPATPKPHFICIICSGEDNPHVDPPPDQPYLIYGLTTTMYMKINGARGILTYVGHVVSQPQVVTTLKPTSLL